MLNSKLISKQLINDNKETINDCLAFLVENNHSSEVLHIGFEENQENIIIQPQQNRPFRASEGHLFYGDLFIKTKGTCLIIKELPINRETL